MLRYGATHEPPVKPRALRFGLLSSEEIRRMSVCEVTSNALYYRGLPASGGLLDPLMGTVDRRHLCATCLRDARRCQGHPGHIELSVPVYHFGFLELVLKTLRTLCFGCSRVCVTDDERASEAVVPSSLRGRNRLLHLHGVLRTRKHCPHCGMPRPTLSRAPLGLRIEWPAGAAWECDEECQSCTQGGPVMRAEEALSMLRHIPAEDVAYLGFDASTAHPKDMIVEALVVPPPCTRPAIYSSEGSRSRGQNDLTARLLEILKRSQDVQLDAPDAQERIDRLQYEVFAFVNNHARLQKPASMGRGGSSATCKSLADRLRGKEGRVRGNLMGKRVDFSARCVITPDANFDCDRVGVPYKIAKMLTIPETVNSINICTLAQRVKRGGHDVHGARSVVSVDGTVTNLVNCPERHKILIRPGDVVERYLSDDDVVVFNRQPSLHLHSMAGHRVRLMPGHTFRLSLVTASPYNADFDGDEMNLHVPQSKAAMAECAALMAVSQNCINVQSNKPVMSIVQDSLLAIYYMTQSQILLDHAHACRLLGPTRHVPHVLPPPAVVVRVGGAVAARHWTGKQLVSCLFPDDLVFETDEVVVRDGQLLMGELRKAHVGTSAGGITDLLCRQHGGVACLRFMGDAQRMTHAFLLQRGHHVGIDDVMLSPEGQARVTERLETARRLCEDIQRDMDHAPPEVARVGESAILRLLSKTLLQAGSIVNEHMPLSNAIRRMVNAGSKGSFVNLSQICAALGQQTLQGGRIVSEKEGRTLPSFSPGDPSIASRGMVVNSFALGLTPTELFYHAVGGREGLVDTAVKTSATGYLQRCMNKSMEDHRVMHDGTVRNSLDEVVSTKWGTDGMHPARLERIPLTHLLLLQDDEVARRFTPTEAARFDALRAQVLRTRTHVLCDAGDAIDGRVLLPFDPRRVQRALAAMPVDDHEEAPQNNVAEDDTRHLPMVVQLVLLDTFCALRTRGRSSQRVAKVKDEVFASIEAAWASPGDSVGCLAAQSIGEPCTQLTLNTFHTSGCDSKAVTMGIPRLKELLDASKSSKTPCTTLRFLDDTPDTVPAMVARTLPRTRLDDVVMSCTVMAEEEARARDHGAWSILAVHKALHHEDETSRFVVCLELHREMMRRRDLTPTAVRALLRRRLRGKAQVLSSEVNAVDWFLLIRFRRVREMASHGGLTADHEAILCRRAAKVLLDTVVLGGHPHITGGVATTAHRRCARGRVREEAVVHAYGHCLAECAALPHVDWSRCTSNDLWEVLPTLGVEACAHVLYDQLKTVVSYDGTYVDDRHLLLLVDTMCRGGGLMPLNRHGINRVEDTSPLMRCSFEETMDVLCEAAVFGESENACGVTSCIMTGQLAKLGTGGVDVSVRDDTVKVSTRRRQGPRVLRSKCRSHLDDEAMCGRLRVEQVWNHPPERPRPASPHEGILRKRIRWRPTSPVAMEEE